jgi:hypothetical protein
MSYHRLYEDPMYDEDGNCVDKDATWQDLEDVDEDELNELSPFATVNS